MLKVKVHETVNTTTTTSAAVAEQYQQQPAEAIRRCLCCSMLMMWATKREDQYDVYYFVWLVLGSCVKRLTKQQKLFNRENIANSGRETSKASHSFQHDTTYLCLYVRMYNVFSFSYVKKIKITFHTQHLNYYHFFFEIIILIYSAYGHTLHTDSNLSDI